MRRDVGLDKDTGIEVMRSSLECILDLNLLVDFTYFIFYVCVCVYVQYIFYCFIVDEGKRCEGLFFSFWLDQLCGWVLLPLR